MQLAQLSSTDIWVSRVGLGTVKFGRNQGVKYPQHFELPTDQDILNLLACARELGINFLDTAPAYGMSEERLGKALQGRRQDWILSTKVGEEFVEGESIYDFSKEKIKYSVRRSLQRLRTDYLDIVLVHSNGDDKKIIEEDEVFATLADLKKAGLIRAFGMSTKTVEGGLLTVEHSDVVMVMHHPTYVEELSVIKAAEQQKKGVLIKKALASGHINTQALTDPVLAALQFIFKESGVTSVILGTLSEEHLRHDVACARLSLTLSR